MKDKQFLFLEKEGVYRTGPATLVGNVEDLLSDAAANVPCDIPALFASPHKSAVHIRVTRQRLTLYCIIHSLVLNTIWRPYGEGSKRIYPHGAQQESADFGATHTWNRVGYERRDKDNPPKDGDMLLYYIMTTNRQGTAPSNIWVAGEVYLVATKKGDKRIYRLPLNNTYEDGRVCMGGGYKLEGKTLAERFNNSLKTFETSPWNTDLHDRNRVENIRALFSFNLKGVQQDIEGDWTQYCTVVSNGNYAELPNLIIP